MIGFKVDCGNSRHSLLDFPVPADKLVALAAWVVPLAADIEPNVKV